MATKAKKDYSQGKIYKIEPIIEHDEGDVYVGSTTKQYLSQRMTAHRNGYKQWKNGRVDYITVFNLFDKYDVANCEITLLETINASNFDELKTRESFYIRTMKCVNKLIPLRNDAEYYQDNREIILEKSRAYYEKNKEVRNKQTKQYYENNREKMNEIKRNYHELNKDKINERHRVHYEANRETILAKQKLARQKKRQEEKNDTNILEIII